jgi:hypothetical protein
MALRKHTTNHVEAKSQERRHTPRTQARPALPYTNGEADFFVLISELIIEIQ